MWEQLATLERPRLESWCERSGWRSNSTWAGRRVFFSAQAAASWWRLFSAEGWQYCTPQPPPVLAWKITEALLAQAEGACKGVLLLRCLSSDGLVVAFRFKQFLTVHQIVVLSRPKLSDPCRGTPYSPTFVVVNIALRQLTVSCSLDGTLQCVSNTSMGGSIQLAAACCPMPSTSMKSINLPSPCTPRSS